LRIVNVLEGNEPNDNIRFLDNSWRAKDESGPYGSPLNEEKNPISRRDAYIPLYAAYFESSLELKIHFYFEKTAFQFDLFLEIWRNEKVIVIRYLDQIHQDPGELKPYKFEKRKALKCAGLIRDITGTFSGLVPLCTHLFLFSGTKSIYFRFYRFLLPRVSSETTLGIFQEDVVFN
jgi:hypothetical protein